MNFKNISNDNLLLNIKKLSAEETRITAEILHHLKEIEFRRLHLGIGYSSLFDYCVNELKYSESQAHRRISAMRLVRDNPEIEIKIKDGSISLTNAAKVQSFIRQAQKEQKPISKIETQKLLQKIENKSTRECELELIKISPEPIITKAKERILSEEYTEVKITLKKDLKNKLDQVKNLLSHQNPSGDLNKLLDLMCDMVIKKKGPAHQRKTTTAPQVHNDTKNISKTSRYIPAAIKQKVHMRDKGCCTFMDPKSKRKCSSQHLLQYDHKYPLSLGRETSVHNLRLLCFQHHKLITDDAQRAGLPSAINQNSNEI